VASFELSTMANAAAEMKEFHEGAVGPSFMELKGEVLSGLKKYINFEWKPKLYSLAAAYVVYTYIYDLFATSPRLFFLGPFGSGKTRAMLTVVYMSRHGWPVLSPSDASSYRSIEALGPTIGVDEAALTPNLLKVLAAGYKRGLSVPRVERTSKERFVLSLFKTFAPVVFAFTEPPTELLMQRTIVIVMKKASDPAKRDPTPQDFEELRGKFYLARLTRLPEVLEAMRKVNEDVTKGVEVGGDILKLEARDYEIWYPVLVAAYLLGEDIYRDVLELAKEDVEARKASLWSEEKVVLAAIERLLKAGDGDEIVVRATEILEEIRLIKQEDLGASFDEKDFKRNWNAVKVGRILTNLGWKNKTTRKLAGTPKAYEITRSDFCDVAERYGYESELCGNCGRCGNFSEKGSVREELTTLKENLHETSEEREKSNKEVGSAENRALSEKVTTVTTLPQPKEFASIEEAVWEVLTLESPRSAVDIYEVLKEWRREGKLKVPVTLERVTKALESLEAKGVIGREWDERLGEELFVLNEPPPWGGG